MHPRALAVHVGAGRRQLQRDAGHLRCRRPPPVGVQRLVQVSRLQRRDYQIVCAADLADEGVPIQP